MNSIAMEPPQIPADSTPHQAISAVIVYEDDAALERMDRVHQRLVREFSRALEFRCVWISFAILQNERMSPGLARIAAEADLVIFTTHAIEQFPQHIRYWIDTWLQTRAAKDSALAALVGSPDDKQPCASGVHRYLRQVAARGRMEFLSGFTELERDANTYHVIEEHATPQTVSTFSNNATSARATEHWGINE